MNMKDREVNIVKLSCIINDIWDAVERSKCGSIFVIKDGKIKRTDEGVPFVNTAAHNVFLTILTNVIPKDFTTRIEQE